MERYSGKNSCAGDNRILNRAFSDLFTKYNFIIRVLLANIFRDIRFVAISVSCFKTGLLLCILQYKIPCTIFFQLAAIIFHRGFKKIRKETTEIIIAGSFLTTLGGSR